MTAAATATPATDAVRFSCRGKVYFLKDVDEVPMRLLLELQQQTADAGRPLTAGDIEEMSERLGKLDKTARNKDPDALWMSALTVWISMRLAGDEITFSEVIDIPLSQLKTIPVATDRQRPAAADPTKRPTRKVSGGAAKPRKRAAGRSSART